ncbi:E3 ubiquitin-protein ligase UBR4-like [Pollicipes pollicipes]|uniref:E3 ubiquitin-protein ligase UBR4-like n=1 Tax=Pollicipes pollicipes TaxID=41117 RepID=UPI001884C225|nr:E3 ubiquitin-protein ligase UBR4-like [Pollicipes pollicipes]
MLRTQNQQLANHANGQLYAGLAALVEFDGYYLESEPCLVCNNPEVAYSQLKLSGVKVDSRYTTTTQLVKLVGSHTISRVFLRIGDLKRSKMVRTINVYYNNRTVQSVVELKNRPSMWHKAKKVSLSGGQTDVKVDFPLPIVACNLMIEYADFYENMQASSETLQCPRCSASVPAHPGVCGNCGENVFQCHKCRAINYDEKDPFLCNACGFCKYAKFEYTLTAKPCCAVDPIESEEDRKKAVVNINGLLERADKIYKKLMSYKPTLEALLAWVNDHGGEVTSAAAAAAAAALALKYCSDCRLAFDDLSKVIQKVLASRRELLRYDRQAQEGAGAAAASAPVFCQCCVTLLRALATNPRLRVTLCSYGLIPQLLEHNLRRGTPQSRGEVCQLLCLLTKDNLSATLELNELITSRVRLALSSAMTSAGVAAAVRHEMALLSAAVQKEDSCWEHRLRCVVRIFMMAGKEHKNPVVIESVTLPCLKILQGVMQPPTATAAAAAAAPQPGTSAGAAAAKPASTSVTAGEQSEVHLNAARWLEQAPGHSFDAWRSRKVKRGREPAKGASRAEVRALFLMEKYGRRWRQRTTQSAIAVNFLDTSWLRRVLFSPSSRQARQVAADMVETLAHEPARKRRILDMLASYLGDVSEAGETAAEFIGLYQKLINANHWKYYLTTKGILGLLADLITKEIESLNKLEETTLNSDLSQGYALKELTDLLASFLELESVRSRHKARLLGTVLHGYLSLRRLVIQRTKLVDETQERLLQLLEDITSGTEAETRRFMAICVETVARYGRGDVRTPVFIFERLCSIIEPEVNEIGPFLLSLEKDPQQEDFLQGRMVGNPYPSTDAGMGPLMRDVKNRICRDCELVALLEDDTGMELLVNNKIISLDLPVKEVYRKVWLPSASSDTEPMRIVYRMRGLLGDATEEFIESLETKTDTDRDDEETYRMANVMSDCGGLQELLRRMEYIDDLQRCRPLLTVLLRLTGLCIKTKRNRTALTRPELRAVAVMLRLLALCLRAIMAVVLAEATSLDLDVYRRFATTCGSVDEIRLLLSHVNTAQSKGAGALLQQLMRVLPFLTFGSQEKMRLLIDHFQPVLDFDELDAQHTAEAAAQLESLCALTAGIETNCMGNQLKDMFVEAGVVERALAYLRDHAPPGKKALLNTNDEQWKSFLARPALNYVLRVLAGLATKHEPTQLAVAAESIPIIHRLEQVSSDQHVGSLAENLLEALRTNRQVATKIEQVRKQTRQEKKRLAMAMRKHQLGALGMRANDKGQVVIKSSVLRQLDDISDEQGLTCVICREGYKFQPTKVLGIYTYTKRCPLDDAEPKQRKTMGYTTVTHFNLVHVDCHMAAVRLARARDEWESAALQNANTRCNGLLPLWGPQVAESAFAHCLARHNTYLQESTGHRDVGYQTTVHDLKLLLLRFAQERSFSDDSGGGGPQSNVYIIPHLMHMALYVINSTRIGQRELKNVTTQLEATADRWVETSFEPDGPLFWLAMAPLVLAPDGWRRLRLRSLARLLVLAQARHVQPGGGRALTERAPQSFALYRPYLIFFGLVDGLYGTVLARAPADGDWCAALAEYIRHHDQQLLEACDRLLRAYQQEMLPCASLQEMFDVLGVLAETGEPDAFLRDALQQVP